MFRLRHRTSLLLLFVFCAFSWQVQTLYLPKKLGGTARTDTVNQRPSDDFQGLHQGNQAFLQEDPALLEDLALNGQRPPFLFLGCSDSRVSEATIFDARPGTFFTARNIANRYSSKDTSVRSALAYGLEALRVKHVIVMGHYGCGGVAASVATPPKLPWASGVAAIQEWIAPIREVYRSSKRTEVVELRQENRGKTQIPEPKLHDVGLRALIEENVKASVKNIASDRVVTELWRNSTGEAQAFFIHGWVYDIENGEVKDLGVSVGPPGQPIPAVPFAATKAAKTF